MKRRLKNMKKKMKKFSAQAMLLQMKKYSTAMMKNAISLATVFRYEIKTVIFLPSAL